MIAHNESGFDSYLLSNILPQRRSVVNSTKNVAGIISLKTFIDYVDENK